jgi:hypothetical protein
MLERCHQLWVPRFCQSALGSKNLLFGGLRWLQSVQIQLPARAATTKASTELLGYDKLWKRIESFY